MMRPTGMFGCARRIVEIGHFRYGTGREILYFARVT